MSGRRVPIIALWLICVALAAWVVAHARYISDLSAFLPAHPTPMQQLLVDQLRDGPTSRLILIAVENGDAASRARMSTAMAGRLRRDAEFSSVNDGEPIAADRDRDYLFQYRYLLSDAVTPQRFTVAGLEAALRTTLENLASTAGLLLKELVPRDPTGEMLRVVDQVAATQALTRDGVWVSADGARALLVAQTRAAGSDTDAQQRAMQAIRTAFSAARRDLAEPGHSLQIHMSGPGVFAVAARGTIERAAVRLSVISGVLVIAVLLAVYRSVPALLLGLLPVASGALIGIAAVALGYGAVHGTTLGFGITLIGESVDYSVYFFIQSSRPAASGGAAPTWQQSLWPTVRLGMLTSVCGFASLLPSGFPGLAQLGLYSISGLVAAALVTRHVLPALLPRGFVIRDVTPLGLRIAGLLLPLRRLGVWTLNSVALSIAALALFAVYLQRGSLWNRELSALSPVGLADQNYDAQLRTDLGVADVRDLVIVSGPDLQSVLRSAERAGVALQGLVDTQVIGSFDSPAIFLPSLRTQAARRASLPDGRELRENLARAATGLNLAVEQLRPFLVDLEAARHQPLLTRRDLQGTSLADGFDALILRQKDRWNALLPLHDPSRAVRAGIDTARVAAALAAAHLSEARVLDLKEQSDGLYAGYLAEAIGLSLAGGACIVVLLLFALRSSLRVARVLAPLLLAVIVVTAALALGGQRLTILHLVGMLLIVAVGSNYALFFDRQGAASDAGGLPLTLASLVIANLSTVIGFGLLAFSQVPVLEALGTTVAPGTFLALLFSAVLAPSPAGDARA